MNSEQQTKRNQDILARFKSGENEAKIGTSYQISRERVRQILNSGLGNEVKSKQMRVNRDQPKIRREEARNRPSGKICKTCLGPVPVRRDSIKKSDCRGITCSGRCAELWYAARTLLDPNEKKLWLKSLIGSQLRSKRAAERRLGQRRAGLTPEPYTNPGNAQMNHRPWEVWQKMCAERRTSKAYKAFDEAMRLRAERGK
jgi:hypothetical protein